MSIMVVKTDVLKEVYDQLRARYDALSSSTSYEFKYGMLEALGLLLDLRNKALEDQQ